MSPFLKLYSFLGRTGTIPGLAACSVIITSNTTESYFESPLSSIFVGLIFGGIGGGIIECITPPPFIPIVSSLILLTTGLNVLGRSIAWIKPPVSNLNAEIFKSIN